jgi:hypothetical protein
MISFSCLLTLCLEPYALSREIEERSLARLRREGNTADDALMVNHGVTFTVDTLQPFPYSNGPKVGYFQQDTHVSPLKGSNPARAGQVIICFLALGFVGTATFFQSAFD